MAIALDSEDSTQVLNNACERNVSAELHYERSSRSLMIARCRIVDIDDNSVYLDQPVDNGGNVHLEADTELSVHFSIKSDWYAFRSAVADDRCKVRLNKSVELMGIAVKIPGAIDRLQRREAFRVSLGSDVVTEVAIHEATPNTIGAAPIDAQRFRASIVDISAAGIGIRIAACDRAYIKEGRTYYVSFRLPYYGTPVCLLVEAKHFRELRAQGQFVAGLNIVDWPPRTINATLQVVSRFIAEMQRRDMNRRYK
jgi:c-di-GMP-binding flagellar brake protein YcgR